MRFLASRNDMVSVLVSVFWLLKIGTAFALSVVVIAASDTINQLELITKKNIKNYGKNHWY